jgi:hypothetical protein
LYSTGTLGLLVATGALPSGQASTSAGRNAQLRATFGVGLLEVAQFVLLFSGYARQPLLIRTSGVMAGVAWSTLHGFVGSEHRPALVHLSSPLSTIHPGDNAQAATALTGQLDAVGGAGAHPDELPRRVMTTHPAAVDAGTRMASGDSKANR